MRPDSFSNSLDHLFPFACGQLFINFTICDRLELVLALRFSIGTWFSVISHDQNNKLSTFYAQFSMHAPRFLVLLHNSRQFTKFSM